MKQKQVEWDLDDSEHEGTKWEGERILTIKWGAYGQPIKKNIRTNGPMNVEKLLSPAPKQPKTMAKVIWTPRVKKQKMVKKGAKKVRKRPRRQLLRNTHCKMSFTWIWECILWHQIWEIAESRYKIRKEGDRKTVFQPLYREGSVDDCKLGCQIPLRIGPVVFWKIWTPTSVGNLLFHHTPTATTGGPKLE